MGLIRSDKASRYFFISAIVNIAMAALITTPVIIARLALPLKLTVWPGTWMFIAYFVFLIVGVLGSLAWAIIYYFSDKILGLNEFDRKLFLIHFILHHLSVYGVSSLMGLAVGYVGGTAAIEGFGRAVITALVSWAVIPIGIFVGLGILGALVGLSCLLEAWMRGRA